MIFATRCTGDTLKEIDKLCPCTLQYNLKTSIDPNDGTYSRRGKSLTMSAINPQRSTPQLASKRVTNWENRTMIVSQKKRPGDICQQSPLLAEKLDTKY